MSQLKQLTVWKDRANPAFIELIKNNVTLTEAEMSTITKAELHYKGAYLGSDDYPDAYDLSTYASEGKIIIRGGLIPLEVGNDPAELIIYDLTNPSGVMWTQIAVLVRDDAAV